MVYKWNYKTPAQYDELCMTSNGEYLTGLWFKQSSDEKKHNYKNAEEKDLPIFKQTTKWLDNYFDGIENKDTPKYLISNITPFRKRVIDIMLKIPYGKTISYGDIANEIAKDMGLRKMSSQAVGGAVGWNPICIIIPCHRVIGSDGKLVGYGGGLNNKISLLKHEKAI